MPYIRNILTGGIFLASDEDWNGGVYNSKYWELAGDSSSKVSQTNVEEETSIEWKLSGWEASGDSWVKQPVLTINGKQYKFNTPEEYISKLKELQSSGASGDLSKMIKELDVADNYWGNPSSSAADINASYQKYFSRNASSEELKYWKTRSADELNKELLDTYKKSSGLSKYDGSAIRVGNNVTDNQLATEQNKKTTVNGITNEVLNDERVKQDKGVNGTTMAKWIEGNAGLMDKLSSLGYTKDDIINEAYSQTRYNKSAFSGDMTVLQRSKNTPTSNIKTEETPALEEQSEITTDTDMSLYDPFIKGDPFLTEQFKDPAILEKFKKMPDTLRMAYIQAMQALGKSIEAGKVINPDITITPEQAKEFTNQAFTELDPYYQEQIKLYKQDLDTSISRLQEDFDKGIRSAEEPFKENLATQAESEAQAGLTYGSERIKRESQAVQEQQTKINDYTTTAQRNIEDSLRSGERKLGSDLMGDVALPTLGNYSVSNKGFSQTGNRNLSSSLTGGLVGELPKAETVALSGRESELEDAYRKQRILNLSSL